MRIAGILVLLFFSSCAHYTYIPLMPVESFCESGELKMRGALGFSHAEGQLSYAPNKFLAFNAGGFSNFTGRRAGNTAISLSYRHQNRYNNTIGATISFAYEGGILGGDYVGYQLFDNYRHRYVYNVRYQGASIQPSVWFKQAIPYKKKETWRYISLGAKLLHCHYNRYEYSYEYRNSFQLSGTGPFDYQLLSPYLSFERRKTQTKHVKTFCGLQAGFHAAVNDLPLTNQGGPAPLHMNFFYNMYLGISFH